MRYQLLHYICRSRAKQFLSSLNFMISRELMSIYLIPSQWFALTLLITEVA
jgi:hypothetical protein